MADERFVLYHGDCLEVMQSLPDESVDVVLTDPPYSSGTRREASKGLRKSMNRSTSDAAWFGSDSLTTNGFVWLIRACAIQWNRLLKPGGAILCFIDWRMNPNLAAAIESADLRHNGLLVWDKTYFGMGTYFRNQHELILYFSKGTANEAQRHDVGNVLSFPPIRGGDHPTEKPIDLLRTLISVVAPPGSLILDPFAGSGSTGQAALLEGCSFIGIEREKQYIALATERLKQQPLFSPATAVPDLVPLFS